MRIDKSRKMERVRLRTNAATDGIGAQAHPTPFPLDRNANNFA
jgi:hypothetical protein